MTTLPQPNYLSTAFYSQYNLILLGGSALFSLASASSLPLAIGCGLELCWLGLGSRLPTFRRRVDSRTESERRARLDEEVLLAMRSLDAEHTARLMALTQNVSMLSMHVESVSRDPAERAAFLRYVRAGAPPEAYRQLFEVIARDALPARDYALLVDDLAEAA